MKTFLRNAFAVARESILHPFSATYFNEDGSVQKRVSRAEGAQSEGTSLVNIFRQMAGIAVESLLHPRCTSYFDEQGRVIKREYPSKSSANKPGA